MLALLQRVLHAAVTVDKKIIGAIDQGILVFLAVEPDDTTKTADRLLERILGYRIFSDAVGRMNLNVTEISGGLLLVPQFTLAADTKKGMRPSFSNAASPKFAVDLFNYFVQKAMTEYANVATGKFAADMQVTLCNNGPVTFLLHAN
jgi:D-aminoacyl-tRNA deacylase